MVDRYTKAVLTVIAAALVWIAFQQSIPNATAGRHETAVIVAQISTEAAKCIAGHVTTFRGDKGVCLAGW